MNNQSIESSAFRAVMCKASAAIGSPAIRRTESLDIDTVYGWEVCHIDISRYGSVSWILSNNDDERVSLTFQPQGDRAESETASAVVQFIARLGYRTSESAVRENLTVLERIQGATQAAIIDCQNRLAEIETKAASEG